MTQRTIFLERQVIDETATSPPFTRYVPCIILSYGAPQGMQDVTFIETLDTQKGQQSEVMLPFNAAAFGIYEQGLENYATIYASSYEALEQQIELAIRPSDTKQGCRSYIRTGPGPLPGH